jgi:hypothetical protein
MVFFERLKGEMKIGDRSSHQHLIGRVFADIESAGGPGDVKAAA